jgi:hypothetical protein
VNSHGPAVTGRRGQKKDGTWAATKRQLLGLMIEVCFKLLSLQRNNQGDVS